MEVIVWSTGNKTKQGTVTADKKYPKEVHRPMQTLGSVYYTSQTIKVTLSIHHG